MPEAATSKKLPKLPSIPKTLSTEEKDEENGPLLADGFEKAFIGYITQFNTTLACYDHEQCIEILVQRDGMTQEEAVEYMSFNVTGAWVGKYTPAFFFKTSLREFKRQCKEGYF
jgi:hypothetical protein